MRFKPVQAFSPQFLNNYLGLARFFKGDEAYSEIQELSQDSRFLKQPLNNTLYFHRWQVIWIVFKTPFETIFSIFLRAVATTSYFLTFKKASRIFTVLSYHMTRDWQQLTDQWTMRESMLMPAFNDHQITSWDLYKLGSIHMDYIEDEDVLKMTRKSDFFKIGMKQALKGFFQALEKGRKKQSWFSWLRRGVKVCKSERKKVTNIFAKKYRESPDLALQFLKKQYTEKATKVALEKLYNNLKDLDVFLINQNQIPLFFNHGLCRGASLWFIYLYLKTSHLFTDPSKQLIAVADQFKTGVSRQGALLQSLGKSDSILKLKKTDLKEHRVSLFELDYNRKSAQEKISSLPNGVYRVGVYHHSFVYVKLSEQERYVWNPNFGLYKMNAEQMLQMILNNHYKPQNSDSHVYFYQYESLERQKKFKIC